MLLGLEEGNNVPLSTASAGTAFCRSLSIVLVVVFMAGCGMWSDESAAPATSTTRGLPSPPAIATTTATPAFVPTATPASSPVTATPQSTVALDRLAPSTRLAYFHTMSSNSDSPDTLAERVGFIVLTAGDEEYRDALRRAGYDGSILQYLNASQVNGPGPYRDSSAACDAEFAPLRNGILRNVGDFCRDVQPNESWFLHNGAGERLYSTIGDTGVLYHMNPGNPAWRAFASQAIASEIVGPKANGYDGLFLDNVELSLTRLTDQVDNADGVVREFKQDSDYRAAWEDYLRQIRARVGESSQLWANLVSDTNAGTTWPGYLAHLDGAMSPAFATGYDPLPAEKWENNLDQAAAAIENGKGIIAVSLGERDDAEWQQFALASYLLIADSERTYFRYMSDESSEALLTLWIYPNYDITLGAALGPRTKTGAIWRREFQCGYIEVNPTSRQGAIVQTACTNGTAP